MSQYGSEPLFIEALKEVVANMIYKDLQGLSKLKEFLDHVLVYDINTPTNQAVNVIGFRELPPSVLPAHRDVKFIEFVIRDLESLLMKIGRDSDAVPRRGAPKAIFKYGALTYLARIIAQVYTFVKFLHITTSVEDQMRNGSSSSQAKIQQAYDEMQQELSESQKREAALLRALQNSGKANASSLVDRIKQESDKALKYLRNRLREVQIRNTELEAKLDPLEELRQENEQLREKQERILNNYVLLSPSDLEKQEKAIQKLATQIIELSGQNMFLQQRLAETDPTNVDCSDLQLFKDSYYKLTDLFNRTVFPLSQFG